MAQTLEKCHLLIFCILNGVKMLKNAGKLPVIYNLTAIRQLTGGLKTSPTNFIFALTFCIPSLFAWGSVKNSHGKIPTFF
jgi:hypothetical protein